MPRTKKSETEAIVPAEPKQRRTPATPKNTTTAVNHKHTTKKSAEPVIAAAKTAKPAVTHDEIAQLAHSYWMARGCQGGSSHEDWFRAEVELRS